MVAQESPQKKEESTTPDETPNEKNNSPGLITSFICIVICLANILVAIFNYNEQCDEKCYDCFYFCYNGKIEDENSTGSSNLLVPSILLGISAISIGFVGIISFLSTLISYLNSNHHILKTSLWWIQTFVSIFFITESTLWFFSVNLTLLIPGGCECNMNFWYSLILNLNLFLFSVQSYVILFIFLLMGLLAFFIACLVISVLIFPFILVFYFFQEIWKSKVVKKEDTELAEVTDLEEVNVN